MVVVPETSEWGNLWPMSAAMLNLPAAWYNARYNKVVGRGADAVVYPISGDAAARDMYRVKAAMDKITREVMP